MKEEYSTSEAERSYRKKYYQQNREKILARQKAYDAEHKEQKLAYQKQYTMTHDRSEYFKEYYRKRKGGSDEVD